MSCVSCHGRIDQEIEVHQEKPLNMAFCLECHRDPAPNIRPVELVTKLDWVPDRDPREIGRGDYRAETFESAYELLGVPPMSLISIKTERPRTGPAQVLAQPRSAGGHAGVPRMGGARISGERDAKCWTAIRAAPCLKLMAASFGLAGLAACRRPVEHILPYSKGVEDLIPGQAYFYSTVMSLGGQVTGLLVETHDGRPTKIEGNPDHPCSLGAATAMQQASILNLYDPDRSRKVLEGGKESSWQKFEAYREVALAGRWIGAAVPERVGDFAVARWHCAPTRSRNFPRPNGSSTKPFQRDNERAGAMLAFGQPVDAAYRVRQSQSDRGVSIPISWGWIRRRRFPPSNFPSAATLRAKKIWKR